MGQVTLTITDEDAKINQYKKNLRTARSYFPLACKLKVVDLRLWRSARALEKYAKEKLHVR